MPYSQQITDFERGKGKLMFKCINNRAAFAEALRERAKAPWKIAQDGTPLCGPAAFMHCIAKDKPSDYVKYVIDLAKDGRAKLGELIVSPSDACKNAPLKGEISPVDWVALASLRDSSNALLKMNSPNANTAGITTAAALAKWFNDTAWYNAASHTTYTSFQAQRFKHLLGINQILRDSRHICLLIRSPIIATNLSMDTGLTKWNGSGTPKTYTGIPDHWIVLDSSLTIGGQSQLSPTTQNQDKLLDQPLRFSFWTWGQDTSIDAKTGSRKCCFVDNRIANITPAQFLPYYYGYVSAMPRG